MTDDVICTSCRDSGVEGETREGEVSGRKEGKGGRNDEYPYIFIMSLVFGSRGVCWFICLYLFVFPLMRWTKCQ